MYVNHLQQGLWRHAWELEKLKKDYCEKYLFTPQAGEEEISSTEVAATTKQEQMTFEDQAPGYRNDVDFIMDETRLAIKSDDASLAEFMSRPTRIAQLQWNVNTSLITTINPWTLFFGNKRVINKIANFRNMRCRLHVKAVIASSPFHYGRCLVSYFPLHTWNDDLPFHRSISHDVVSASQRPCIWVNPAAGQGGELIFPFYWYKDALDVVEADWEEMGELFIRSATPLRHATAGTDPVNLSIFAWATEVSLTHPTSHNPSSIVPQGGEFSESPVSAPATAVANIASALKSVPVLSPYAKATEIGARAIASVAKMFGFSRPRIIDNVTNSNIHYIGNMANTNAHDSSVTTATDVKQEISVWPAIHGLGSKDEMSFIPIVCNESLLAWRTFSDADVVDSTIMSVPVTPDQWSHASGEIHIPACAAISQLFRYWRGTMRFRFSVVCSKMHRGRLRIIYDPYSGVTSPEFNTAYQHVIDIGEDTDATIEVAWASPLAFLNTRTIVDEPDNTNSFSLNAPVTHVGTNEANGEISVQILDPITGPGDTNALTLLVHVSMTDDAQFMNPTEEHIKNITFWENQGGEMDQEMDSPPTCAPPDAVFGQSVPANPNVYGGEVVASLRTLMKRYAYVSTWFPQLVNRYVIRRIWDLLGFRGDDPNGVHVNGSTPSNIYAQTVMHYIMPAFAGWSGALRYKYFLNGSVNMSGSNVLSNFTFSRMSFPSVYNVIDYDALNAGIGDVVRNKSSAGCRSLCGAVLTPTAFKNVIEAEIPFQPNVRFRPCRQFQGHANTQFVSTHQIEFQTTVNGNSDSTRQVSLETWMAVGEDFNLTFWLGMPPFYKKEYSAF